MMGAEKTVLENGDLLVEINRFGAELARIYDKTHQREVLWEGKPEIWGRHAPILFPFVGKCYEDRYYYEGKAYPMTSHGFARDMEFTLVSQTEEEVWYQLESTEETLKKYPFSFCLQAGIRLEGNQIHVMWKVKNLGENTMYFMLGGHPAFPTPEGLTVHDFTLDFHRKNEDGPLHYQAPSSKGYQEDSLSGELSLQDGRVKIDQGFFKRVLTYIFDRGQVKEVSLLLPGEVPYVTVRCPGIPYTGVWTVEDTHPFVCLEPWFGRCDKMGYEGELKDREGEVSLEAGKEFVSGYVIEIHKN